VNSELCDEGVNSRRNSIEKIFQLKVHLFFKN